MTEKNTKEEYEISLLELLQTVWGFRWIILLLGILGILAGGLFSMGNTPFYQTEASMLVNTKNAGGTYQNGTDIPGQADIQLAQNLAKTVQLLAVSDRVLEKVLEGEQDIHITVDQLKERITVTEETDTSFLWLTLDWESPSQAIRLLNRLMDTLPSVMLEVLDIGSVNVIDTARQAKLVAQGTEKKVMLGAGLGMILGCVMSGVYYLFIPKIQGNHSMGTLGIDVIGEIPLLTKKGKDVSGYLDEEHLPQEYLEAYGRLSAVFRYLAEKEDRRIIAVTSSIAGEGKSTITYNLALRLKESGCKVLLLDFDFKKGVLYRLARERKPKDGNVRTEARNAENLKHLVERMYNGLYTIQGFSEQELFRTENELFPALQAMKNTYEYILIDTPPVGILSDVQQMRGLIDGVLLVVRAGKVSRQEVEEASSFLKQAGLFLMGSILNGKESLIPHISHK